MSGLLGAVGAGLVGGVLAVAAWTKARQGRLEIGRAAVDLGAPAALAAWLGLLLVPMEAVTAALLLLPPLRVAGAAAAIALLGLFTAVLVSNLAAGHRPACACFGALGSGGIGWSAVARNVGLMAAAAITLLSTPASGLAAAAAAWLAAAAAAVLLLVSTRAQALRRDGVPAVRMLEDPEGRRLASNVVVGGEPTLVLYVSMACGSCRRLVADVTDWREHVRVLVLSRTSAAEVVEATGVRDDVYGELRPPWSAELGLRATPAGAYLEGGRVVEVATGSVAFRRLAERVTGVAAEAPHRSP